MSGSAVPTDANGVATVGGWTLGQTVGPQSITASITTAGVTAATLGATARVPYWTVLVYMAADNNLALAGVADIDEMEAAGSDPEVQVIVQAEFSPDEFAKNGCDASCIGRPNFNTFRYVVSPGTSRDGPDGPVVDLGGNRDMTSTSELREFVAWGQQAYPAQRTMLVLWDHGGGYRGMLQDETSAGGTMMDLDQLQPALSGLPLEILAFDMCLMAGYETLESMAGLAPFAVFSEELIPGEGFPYDALINGLQANPIAPSRSFAALASSSFHTSYQGHRASTTISAYDLGQYSAFRSALATVAQTLTGDLGTLGPAIASAAVTGQKYTYSELTDLVTFVDSLSVRVAHPALLSQLAALRAAAVSGFRVDNRFRNGSGVGLGGQADVTRSTGLHVVLPTGLDGDQFFADGTKSLIQYQSLYPGLPWTAFLAAWTASQATTPFIDQSNARWEGYLAWHPDVAATGADIDLWLLEPSGNLYIPFLGTVTPNGDFTPESADAGTSWEGWITRQYIEVGTYTFYANLWVDPTAIQPLVQFAYRSDQVSPLIPLYAPGTEPQLSVAVSWLADATPTLAEADAFAYSDLQPVAVLDITAAPAIVAEGSLDSPIRNLKPQVVRGHLERPRPPQRDGALARPAASGSAPRGPRTVTPSITSGQLQTARQLSLSRVPIPRRNATRLPSRP